MQLFLMQIFAEITSDAAELTAGVYTLRKWDRISAGSDSFTCN